MPDALTKRDVMPGPGDWEGMWREAEQERAEAVAECDRLREGLMRLKASGEVAIAGRVMIQELLDGKRGA